MNTIYSLLKNLRNRTPVGTIQMYGGSSSPTNWLKCDGTAVSRETYASLYAVIGTTYGNGDGVTTFNLPDLTDRMPIGAGSTYALNASGGSANAIIPYHRHSVAAFTNASNGSCSIGTSGGHKHLGYNTNAGGTYGAGWNPTEEYAGNRSASIELNPTNGTHTHTVPNHTHTISAHNTNYEGVSVTNANMPPYRAVNFIIYAGV